jgi:CubicO group peptidase (beta-lactamase class C family)
MASRSTVRETLRRFRDKPLVFTPGARFSYTNSGYVVLGYIIEQVSGKSYAVYLRDNIFQPLDMMNTGYDVNYVVLKDRASGYRRMGANRFWNADYIDMSILHAAAGLYSTVEDLYLWDRALHTEALVSQSTLDLMFTPHMEEYGYGWGIGEYSDRKVIYHGGEIDGFVTAIARFVDDDVVFIVLSNVENAPFFDEIEPGLISIVFEEN